MIASTSADPHGRAVVGQLRVSNDETAKKLAFGVDQVRAVPTRSQAGLERAGAGFKRQLATAWAAPAAAMRRAEQRLRTAYDQIDHVCLAAVAIDTISSKRFDGSAATRPMRDEMWMWTGVRFR